MKIRDYLLLLVSALALPLAALLGFNIWSNQNNAIKEAEQTMTIQAEVMATNIGTKLKNIRHRLGHFASQPPARLLDPQHCDPTLPALLDLHPEYANIVSADLAGTSICSAVPHPPGARTSVAAAPWFKQFLEKPRFMVGEPFFGPIVKKNVMVVAEPIYDRQAGDGSILGTIAVTIRIDSFDPELPTQHLPERMRYGFINERGVLLWRNVDAGEIGQVLESDAGRRVVAQRDGHFKARASDNLDRLYAVKWLPEFELIAFISIPEEDILQPARQTALTAGIVALLALGLLVALALGITRRIVAPASALEQAVIAMQDGNNDSQAPVTGPHELAAIATAFNRMQAARQAIDRERQQALEDMRESEERFRQLFEDTSQPITLIQDGRFIAANTASLVMMRMASIEDLLGHSPVEFSPERQPDGRLSAEKAAELINEALAQGNHRFEWEHLRADGEPFTADVLLTAIRRDGKDVLHVVWNDITAQKQTERELAEYREQLEARVAERTAKLETITASLWAANQEQEAIFDAATAGIVFVRNRQIVRCNRMMEQLFGYSPGEMIGLTTRGWYADDAEYAAIGQRIAQALSTDGFYAEDRELIRKDGSRFWGRMKAQAVDPADLSKGLAGMIEDISAEHAAVEALQLANAEQQTILDTATTGIALIKERFLVRCNRRLHDMLGWPAGSLVGRPTAVWYADEEANRLGGDPVYAAIWRGEAHTREQQLMRNDGSLFWARLTGHAIDINDHARGSVWVIEDITPEHAAIEEMKKARALAEEAARTKSDFLANMSHEIRTPMNAIIGMSHLALKTDLTPRQRDYLKKIQGSSQHLLGIINDILDFSKIEAGKLLVEHTDFELERVLDNVAGLIAEKCASKGLELIVDIAPDVPTDLIGDPLRIGQVLINYANNAVKFTEQGEIDIRIELARDCGEEVVLRFSVRDTGIGISEEQRGHLFKSFEQADTSTTRKFGGTGLGLAISKRLAELMRGEVGVDSTPGVGSTFWFTARLGRGQPRKQRLLPDPDLRGRRVLVVDDNDNARDVLGDMLRGMTFIVAAVPSGAAAVAEVRRAAAAGEPYEIVFLDWQMPEMDGLVTAQAIRALGLTPAPHLAMVTAYGRDELFKPASEAGIEHILMKPLSASLLFDAAMRMLGGARGEQPDDVDHAPTIDLSEVAGAHLLLVEDNDLNQEVASEILSGAGFIVDVAADGQVALDLLAQHAYDLVLMDMQMPVMDGLTATREIRKRPELAHLPVVAMTANAMAGDRERCLEAGMNDHIAKPIDPEDLFTKLRHWLKPRNVAQKIGAGRTAVFKPPAATPPTPLPDLNGIDGFDPALGLRRALGREPLYRSLLDKFIGGARSFAKQFKAAIAAGEPSAAERLAHTLKSTAGQVGAVEVSQLAEQLEHACHAGAPTQPLLEPLLARLAPLLDTLATRLPGATPVTDAMAVDPEKLQVVVAELARQLGMDDFSAGQLLEANEALLRAGLGEHYAWIAEAVQNFNFSAASDWLKEAATERGIPL